MADSKLRTWLQLLRLPNVFTAVADILVGYLFFAGTLEPYFASGLLVLATCLLYSAGMVLNDVFDVEQDTEERPHRPIPSGRVTVGSAAVVGWFLLAAGVACAAAAGLPSLSTAELAWRPGVVAVLLACCVVAYDAVLKKGWLGPLGMGGCRFFNILLGMSAAETTAPGAMWALGYYPEQLVAAGAIGLYIVGVTLFAKTEAKVSNRGMLIAGVVIMTVGILSLVLIPRVAVLDLPRYLKDSFWMLAVLVLMITIVRPATLAIVNPIPVRVQQAVKHCIFSLIVLDAAIAAYVGGPIWAIVVLSLLIPSLVLGRWLYST